MTDEEKPEITDQEAPPAEGQDQETPPATPETPPKETTPADGDGEERPFDSQGAYTKFTQRISDRFRSLEEKIERALSAPPARAESPPSTEETAENPQVEKIVRGTRAFRELAERAENLQKRYDEVASLSVSQALAAKFPELAPEMPQFMEWVAVPGRAEGMKAAGFQPAQIIAAYRAEHPAKGTRKAPATPKPAPKVEGETLPGGVVRDITEKLRAKGITRPAFSDVLAEASKEIMRGSG